MMRNLLKTFLVITVSTFCLQLIGATVSANPIAPPSKYNEKGLLILKQQHKSPADIEKEIPSAETVGIPVYPGATYASSAKENHGMPPFVNLISTAPPEKVKEWYKEHLKGWGYSEMLHLFYDAQKEPTSLPELFGGKYQTVGIQKEEGGALDTMFVDTRDVKTRIQIVYKPKK